VLPGEEGTAGPSVTFVARSGEHLANGSALRVIGSGSVERVRFSADGQELAVVPGDRGRFALTHTFATPGSRRLSAEGLDGEDQVIAREEIEAIIDR
jgi:hypothetical protein